MKGEERRRVKLTPDTSLQKKLPLNIPALLGLIIIEIENLEIYK